MPATSAAAPAAEHLVILVAPPGLLGGVLETLQDWSTLGLISPFCWVEDPADSETRRVSALEIVAGRAAPVRLETVLATRDPGRVRLCVLVPAFSTEAVVNQRIEDQLAQLVRANSGSASVDFLRCTVARPGQGPGAAPIAREGWHNLVLSPEDARGPGLGHQLLDSTDDPFEVGPHAAAAICGLTGLWAGITEAPMDAVGIPRGRVVRVARCFFRKLDADEVSDTVRDGVLSMAGELPRPRVANGRAVAVEDVALATSTMADQLWAKHADVLNEGRAELPVTEVKPIGAGQALKMLFGFLVATLKNAPMAWYTRLVNRVSAGAAGLVHKSVFGGAPSAYQVVVRGVRPDGSRADWRDLASASSQINEIVSNPGQRQSHAAHADLGRLWRDFAQAAFTLADAGERTSALPPVAVGVDRGVVTRAGDCAPGPETDFTVIPVGLRSIAGQDRLAAADILGVLNVRERLAQARIDPAAGPDADRTLQALDRWVARHQHSFAVQSGLRLGRRVNDLAAEVKNLLAALETAGEAAKPSDELRKKQRRLAWLMRAQFIVFLLIVIVMIVLGANDVVTWTTVVITCLSALVAWLVGTFFTFLRSQRNLFAELHRRQVAAAQGEVNWVNLRHALNDLRRTTGAYAQHLCWSRLLGIVLARPFGDAPAGEPKMALREESLPLGMRLGVARPESTVISNTNAQLRRAIFGEGWLTRPWERIIEDAPARLGPDGLDLRDDPRRLFSERGGDGSLLASWVELIEREGPGTASGDWLWSQALAGLAGSPGAQGLLERVSVGPQGTLQPRESFMSGVDRESTTGRTEIFDAALFSPDARSQGRNEVTRTWRTHARDGLSQISVTAQLSEALPDYDLVGLQGVEAVHGDLAPTSNDVVF